MNVNNINRRLDRLVNANSFDNTEPESDETIRQKIRAAVGRQVRRVKAVAQIENTPLNRTAIEIVWKQLAERGFASEQIERFRDIWKNDDGNIAPVA